ncbi:YolD-like family protein [Paenibacillus hamazuiensis]|uniref:YolD-like family protein n=1 Tax=Paenibacillus hamazuiensis TaxID=2936508 RepID=UPI00200F4C83|nr:YolD-like family protein [Paenibacillus hamazuiensis]
MSKKLQGNGLFASSRMMLPEHKLTINRHLEEIREYARPSLDPQEAEHISRCLTDSLAAGTETTLVRYGARGCERVKGVVVKMDPLKREVTLSGADGGSIRVPFADLVDVLEDP